MCFETQEFFKKNCSKSCISSVHERSVLTECNWFFWMNVLILLSESAKVADYALHSISANQMEERSPV
jgi:hypothetical protein